MDLRQLEYVDAIARNQSFTRAAEDLHVAQPGLSLAVRQLEAELGVRLFDRSSRHVNLTSAGQVFVDAARSVLADVAQLQTEMSHYADGTRGVLRASLWYHVSPPCVSILREYNAANPGVQMSVVECPAPKALDFLRSGELDIASFVMSDRLDLTGIEHRVIRTEPAVLVTQIDHPLASRGSVHVDELAEEPLIMPHLGTSARQSLDALVGPISPPIVAETNEVAAMLDLVSIGIGSAVAAASVATRIGAPVGIVRIEGAPPWVLAVAWASGPHDLAVQRAIDVVSAMV